MSFADGLSASTTSVHSSTAATLAGPESNPLRTIVDAVDADVKGRSAPPGESDWYMAISRKDHPLLPLVPNSRQLDWLQKQLSPLFASGQRVRIEYDADAYVIRVLDPYHDGLADGVKFQIVTLIEQIHPNLIMSFGSSNIPCCTPDGALTEREPDGRFGAARGAGPAVPFGDRSNRLFLVEVSLSQPLLSDQATTEKLGAINKGALFFAADPAEDKASLLAAILIVKGQADFPTDAAAQSRYPESQGAVMTRFSQGMAGLLGPYRRIQLYGQDLLLSSMFGTHPLLSSLPHDPLVAATPHLPGAAAAYDLTPPQPATTGPTTRPSWTNESQTGPLIRFPKWHFYGPRALRLGLVPPNAFAPVDLTSAIMHMILRSAAYAQREHKGLPVQ